MQVPKTLNLFLNLPGLIIAIFNITDYFERILHNMLKISKIKQNKK